MCKRVIKLWSKVRDERKTQQLKNAAAKCSDALDNIKEKEGVIQVLFEFSQF